MKRGYVTGTAIHEIRILPGVIQEATSDSEKANIALLMCRRAPGEWGSEQSQQHADDHCMEYRGGLLMVARCLMNNPQMFPRVVIWRNERHRHQAVVLFFRLSLHRSMLHGSMEASRCRINITNSGSIPACTLGPLAACCPPPPSVEFWLLCKLQAPRVNKGRVPGSWFRDSALNTANSGPMALVFASHHWHHMRSPSQANNGGTNLARKKLQAPTAAPNSSEAYIYLWMPFLLDFLFLSIFTLSPAPGRWFIVPNSDRVTRDIPSCIFVCCFLRQSFPLHIPFLGHFLATDEIGFHPLGFWKHNRRQSLFLVQPTDIPPANRSVRLCASAILPSKLQETFEVLAEKPIQEPRAGFAGNQYHLYNDRPYRIIPSKDYHPFLPPSLALLQTRIRRDSLNPAANAPVKTLPRAPERSVRGFRHSISPRSLLWPTRPAPINGRLSKVT
ncbi:hypothetical protein HCDG_06659 [Histoplasma capsulatum H143]|uniref:Uncharacterized protein n=1 Tax=Ajellomyces capsulatus (strain H143) TaxID=544712 RepID=C6HKC8_AJECH|nr:hypothetical protein HCDG_06659 [Histoplasma capsulatum H143]